MESLGSLGRAGAGSGPATLADVLFGRARPRFAANPPLWTPLNERLDTSQRRALTSRMSNLFKSLAGYNLDHC